MKLFQLSCERFEIVRAAELLADLPLFNRQSCYNIGHPIIVRLVFSGSSNIQLAGWSELFKNYLTHPPLAMLLPMWTVLWLRVLGGK